MALVTNNISSSLNNSTIGITGSLIVGNAASLPSMPGADVTFFVSGTNGGVSAGTGVAVFGGDVVISGTLHGGSPLKIGTDVGLTGSLRLSNQTGAEPASATGEAILFASESSPGSTKLYFAAAGGAAVEVGSSSGTPGGSDTHVQFNDGGVFGGESGLTYTKSTETVRAANLIVTGTSAGSLTTSGTFHVKNGTDVIVGSISTLGVVSGSGQLEGASVAVDGAITAGGNVAVNGGTITTTLGTLTLGASSNRVLVPGDFEVQGTTVTVDVTNITVEDPLIGLGFTTGSVAAAAGDRGFIGGRAATSNVAFAWAQSSDAFVATTTTSAPGDASIAFTAAALKPVRASRFQVSGTNAVIWSPNGSDLTVGSTSITLVSGSRVEFDTDTQGVVFKNVGFPFATVTSSSFALSANAAKFAASAGKSMLVGANSIAALSGTQVYLLAGTNGVNVQRDGTDFIQFLSGSGATGNDAIVAGVAGNQLRLRASDRVYFSNVAGTYAAVRSGSFGGYGNASVLESSTGKTLVLDGKQDLALARNGTTISYIGDIGGTIGLYPNVDMTYNLGDPTRRWNNIYTGDLHLRNDRGDYTIIEEADFLSIRFNKTGKRYKFVLEPVPELDE